jgi:hypothetical protein
MQSTAIRQAATSPLSLDRWIAVGTLASFLWLLLTDRIPPVAVLMLELFLGF